eukprot:NODE_408_length_9221_cov_0.216400.p3 type:complete len:231 gc:universal NODE_408_length_9221_cov_0.216400:4712-5404(+)
MQSKKSKKRVHRSHIAHVIVINGLIYSCLKVFQNLNLKISSSPKNKSNLQFGMSVHVPSIETAIYLLERAKHDNDKQLLLSALDAIVIALPELDVAEQLLIKEKLVHYYELTQPVEEVNRLTGFMTSFAVMIKQSPIPSLLNSAAQALRDILFRLDNTYHLQQHGILFVRQVIKKFVNLMWRLETEFKLSEKMVNVAKQGSVLVGKTVVAYHSAENYEVRKRKAKRSVSL